MNEMTFGLLAVRERCVKHARECCGVESVVSRGTGGRVGHCVRARARERCRYIIEARDKSQAYYQSARR